MTDESKYATQFASIDLDQNQSVERLFCTSGHVHARQKKFPQPDLTDPSDYCNALLRRSIDDYIASGRALSLDNHKSLLDPYVIILADKGYRIDPNTILDSTRVLLDLMATEIKGDDGLGPVRGTAAGKTGAHSFDPFDQATPDGKVKPFVLTPGAAVDVGAVWATLNPDQTIDTAGYSGKKGIAKRDKQLQQCRLNNQANPLDPDAAAPAKPLTFDTCFDLGAVLATQHLRPETASLGALPVQKVKTGKGL